MGKSDLRSQDQSPDLSHTHLTCQIEKGKEATCFQHWWNASCTWVSGVGAVSLLQGPRAEVARGIPTTPTGDQLIPQSPRSHHDQQLDYWPLVWVGGGSSERSLLLVHCLGFTGGYTLSISALNGGDPKAENSISGSVLSLLWEWGWWFPLKIIPWKGLFS